MVSSRISEHWKYLDQMLADPAFRHVNIDLSWGPIIAPYIVDTPEHLKMTADLIRKYPDRFLYGSEQGVTTDWKRIRKAMRFGTHSGRSSALR